MNGRESEILSRAVASLRPERVRARGLEALIPLPITHTETPVWGTRLENVRGEFILLTLTRTPTRIRKHDFLGCGKSEGFVTYW